MNNEFVAMILAGGQGTRLLDLTKPVAKPAVSFGSRYRIIDFTLSNCLHSNIKNVGILTQYKPLELMVHIGNGNAWELDINNGGVSILPPYQTDTENMWYKGTADAIYANLDYLDMYNPEYVLILSGDHIYSMDYQKMLDFHKEKNADLTIAVMEVNINEAYRFGIMSIDKNSKIYEFEEKPKKANSNLASMGVYIFNYQILKKYLVEDSLNSKSNHDFGGNIIPSFLNKKEEVYAFKFNGYWKDVGTVDSLWSANMDLLNPDSGLNLNDRNWRVYSRDRKLSPQYFGKNSSIVNSIVGEGAFIDGIIENSVISTNVTIEKDVVIKNSVILPNSYIKSGANINYCIVARDCIVDHCIKCEGNINSIALITNKGGVFNE